jgi:hypothetical protein
VVQVSGNAGPGCVIDKNWSGFEFKASGEPAGGPKTRMTPPVATNGLWTAAFVIPPYLAGSPAGGPGAPVTPGRYEFTAPTCQAQALAKASFHVTGSTPATTSADYVDIAVTRDGHGYWLARADGAVAAFGDAGWHGSLPADQARPKAPIVGIARTYDAQGYWLADADGRVYSFGDARPYGSAPLNETLSAPITGIAATADGRGYWLAGVDGRVYSFGDARSDGAPDEDMAPYDAIEARPAGGYVLTAAKDAAAYIFPGGTRLGGGPGFALSAMLVGTAVTPTGNGTWQVGVDGGVFTWGDATYYGSLPGDSLTPEAPITGIAGTPDGHGYWLLGADGNVFSFGDAHFFGFAVQQGK